MGALEISDWGLWARHRGYRIGHSPYPSLGSSRSQTLQTCKRRNGFVRFTRLRVPHTPNLGPLPGWRFAHRMQTRYGSWVNAVGACEACDRSFRAQTAPWRAGGRPAGGIYATDAPRGCGCADTAVWSTGAMYVSPLSQYLLPPLACLRPWRPLATCGSAQRTGRRSPATARDPARCSPRRQSFPGASPVRGR